MVSDLVDAAQLWLGNEHSVTAAVLSSPDRTRLPDEDVNDAFDHLKTNKLMDHPHVWQDLYANSAAYAGYGKGLCSTYTDAYACEQEECHLQYQGVLQVDWNRKSLSGTIQDLQGVPGGSRRVQFVDLDLGHAPTVTSEHLLTSELGGAARESLRKDDRWWLQERLSTA